ncbi:uncharacterized protein LOC141649617 [Silene latifolia]|uniref:uncharacterized protein LOC141649617 n=1 Tax=Silene latifolia TaxID=37657 RepID=UPI003D788437
MKCVGSASFPIALNGNTFGFFKSKRDLRQGDPMSPLLFTFCMEYLSRILTCATEKLKFHYHLLCKHLKLTYVMFAYDLLLFSKGDGPSIMVLLRAFSAFSLVSGLKMNSTKSKTYFNGVPVGLKKDIFFISGFTEGKIPFKYLGAIITAGRLKKIDCAVLIDKIVEKIKNFGGQETFLCYQDGDWLNHTPSTDASWHWKKICKVRDTIRDGFVSDSWVIGNGNYTVKGCYNWIRQHRPEGISSPSVPGLQSEVSVGSYSRTGFSDQGGMGVCDIRRWNVATVGKYVWWLMDKKDHLWVKWVHRTYLKGMDWTDYKPPQGSSWDWKRICRVKERLLPGYVHHDWLEKDGTYLIAKGYKWIGSEEVIVDWHSQVWLSAGIPKHRFISWLFVQARLLTLDRLNRMIAVT